MQCSRDAKKSIQPDLGSEVLQWALSCEDFPTSLKEHQIYRALLQPADMNVVDGLIRALFVCLSSLGARVAPTKGGGCGGVRAPRQSTAPPSETHFQTIIAASETVATLQAITIAFGTRTRPTTCKLWATLQLASCVFLARPPRICVSFTTLV